MKRDGYEADLLQRKTFVQRRKAQKVVREVYLRDDISCGSQLCALCHLDDEKRPYEQPPSILSARPRTFSNDTPHYVVPDTNIFYHCMDIMEQADVFADVIVLQTALDELRNKSLPLYNRLRQLVADADKRFYVFHNEFHADTYSERRGGETVNDRNDRVIRLAAAWYKNHLSKATRGTKSSTPNILLLSDDRLNRAHASKENILTESVEQYLNHFPNAAVLLDMVASSSDISKAKAGATVYADHLGSLVLQDGVRQGRLHQGILNVSTYNYLEATVTVPSFKMPIHVIGRENLNRAVQGDVVVLEILPDSEWILPRAKLLAAEDLAKNENADVDGVEEVITAEERDQGHAPDLHRSLPGSTRQRTAKVVGITKRGWRPYVGHVDTRAFAQGTQSRGSQTIFVLPVDRRIPKIRIKTRQAADLAGQKLLVNIDRWDKSSRYPTGHFVRILGATESKAAETEALLLEWDVQYRPFPKAVLDCLPAEGDSWAVPQNKQDSRWVDRADLRGLLICSIDPPGCQDIDDALHAKILPNGNIEVGVHIADVSSFVKADTAMDSEAASRGTTVYMVDKRIDMLPHLLGTNLCSLMPYVERFAFSTIWELSLTGEVKNTRFTKSVIKSREAFSYEQAQLRINDTESQDELTQGMRLLLTLSKELRMQRLRAGALNLASPEVRIEMDNETSDPIEVQTKKPLETNSLVEEFMLLANISVATRIYEAYPETAMLRRHGAPPSANFEVLQDVLRVRRNIHLQVDSSKALADSLDLCIDNQEPFFNTLVRIMATRCMLSAEYFSSGSFSQSEFRHYGLASQIYTHFTSPIRRYADVIAHRQLSSAIGFEPLHPSLQNQAKMEKICDNINYRHRMAQQAGRASVEYYVGQALKDQDVTEIGHIMKVFQNGFVVFVAKFGVEGVITIESLTNPAPPTEFVPDQYNLIVNPGSVQELHFGVFDKVKVKVATTLDSNTGKRKLELTFVEKL